MPDAHRTFVMNDLAAGARYDILSGLVVPRPIAFVSTLSEGGVPNLAPFSYFMVGGVRPASLMFCPVLGREGEKKDTLANIEATGEFVVNLVTREMAEGMNATSYAYGSDEDEWAPSGFGSVESTVVKPPRVAESPVQFECRLYEALQHGSGAGASVYVVGEVLVAHVASDLVDGEAARLSRFEPISRLGGREYLDLACGKVFELARPKGPAGSSLE